MNVRSLATVFCAATRADIPTSTASTIAVAINVTRFMRCPPGFALITYSWARANEGPRPREVKLHLVYLCQRGRIP